MNKPFGFWSRAKSLAGVSPRWHLGAVVLCASFVAAMAPKAHADQSGTPAGNTTQPAPQVRALPDSGVTQQNGAFTSRIAISVPAFHGITPDLALSYNSSGGNGFAGVGWDLEGFSEIERASPGRGSPRLGQTTVTDIFLLDGEELVSLGNNQYATRRQSFLRISGSATSNWTVTRRDGTVLTYTPIFKGGTSSANTLRWGLNKVQDAHGNTVNYTWWCDTSAGLTFECYPDKVSYGNVLVTFFRESRNDKDTYATGYNLGKRNFRLKSVAQKVGGAQLREYALVYQYSARTGRSLLKTVQQFGGDATVDWGLGVVTGGTSLPQTTISWSDTPSGLETAMVVADHDINIKRYGLSLTVWQHSDLYTSDFNGDGRADFLLIYADPNVITADRNAYLILANATGSFNNYIDITSKYGMNSTYWYHSSVKAMGDFNGDGASDLLLLNKVETDGYSYRVFRLLGSASGLSTVVDIASKSGMTYQNWLGNIDPGDFNGDGKLDLLLIKNINSAHLTSAFLLTASADNTGNFNQAVDITSASGMNSSTYGDSDMWSHRVTLGDFNGDGRTDLLVDYFNNTLQSYLTLLLQASSGTTPGFNTVVNISSKSGLTGPDWEYANLLTADFNGDGKTDLLFQSTSDLHPFYLLYAQGSDGGTSGSGNVQFDNKVDVTNLPGMSDKRWRYAELVLGDYNGDGRTDILIRSRLEVTPTIQDPIMVLYSNGASFNTPVDVTNLYGMSLNSWCYADFRVADFDGDGDEDLLIHASVTATNGSIPYLPDMILKGSDNKNNVITGLANGYGGNTAVTYTPSSAWTSTNNPPREQTVTSLTLTGGRSGTPAITTTYAYDGGAWDPVERRHLGFHKVTATDSTGAYTTSFFYQGAGYRVGELQDFYQYDASPNHVLLSRSLRTLTLSAAAPWVSNLTTQDDWECDSTATCKRAEKTFGYDSYGNVTTMTEWGDFDVPGDERTTEYNYAAPSAGYLVSYPAVVTVHQGAGIAGTVLKQSRYDYDGGTLAAAPVKGDVTRTENWLNTTGAYLASTATYDGFGNQTSLTDPLGHVTSTNWETTWGLFPLVSTNALNQIGSMTWDPVCGTQSQATDLNGQITTWTYDKLCRRLKETRPDGGYTDYGYTNFGSAGSQYTSETINGSLWHSDFFDGLGRQWQSVKNGIDSSHNETVLTNYDARGQVASISAPYGTGETPVLTRYSYDALRRLTVTTFADNSTRQMLYGNWMATTCDELGKPRTSYRDAYGQVRQVREYKSNGVEIGCSLAPACSLGTTCWDTRIDYDLLGQQLMVTDAVGNISTNTYDSLGRRTAMTDVDLGSWTYRYDDDGSLISQTDAKSQVTDFWYDALHRMVNKTYKYVVVCPKGQVCPQLSTISLASYNYDEPGHGAGIGRRTSMLASGASTSFTYDAMGRVTSEQASIGASAYTIGRTYDTFGRVKTITYPDGEMLPYTYDAAGRMATAGGYVSSATYDARGNPKSRGLGNGVQQNWTYDTNRFWLANVNANLNATQFMSIDLGHNARGEIKTRRNGSQNDNWDYTYDDLRRLTIATNISNGAWTQGFSYDAVGRMTSQTGYGASANTYPALGTGPQHAPATIGGLAASYDFNGNLLSGAGNSISYDRLNRPAMVNAVSMAYDADGARTMEGNTVFVSNLFEADTSASPATTTNYIFFNDQLVARKRAGAVSYYHGDSLGSVAMMTNSSGAVVLRKTYAPFGKVLVTTGTLTDAFGLAGQRLDPTGLYHMGAREMSPALGIFVTPDPSNAPNPERPQTLNRYSYANNSPTYLYDPTGYATTDANQTPAKVVNGVLQGDDIVQNQISNIEHGPMGDVKAITLHQTDSPTASSTLNAWKTRQEGAHFLIGEDGTIYQTASLDNKTWHVGMLQSRCKNEGTCSAGDLAYISNAEKQYGGAKGQWGRLNASIYSLERKKDFPDRYPFNEESIGIEVVGMSVNKVYPAPNAAQLQSVNVLVTRLQTVYGLSNSDVYHHGQTGTRPPTECSQCGY